MTDSKNMPQGDEQWRVAALQIARDVSPGDNPDIVQRAQRIYDFITGKAPIALSESGGIIGREWTVPEWNEGEPHSAWLQRVVRSLAQHVNGTPVNA